LTDVSADEAAAFNAAGDAGASAANRLATKADVEAASGGGGQYAKILEGQSEVVINQGMFWALEPYHVMPEMSITDTFSENAVKISFNAAISGLPAAGQFAGGQVAIFVDGIRKDSTPKVGTLRYVDPTPGGWTTAYEMVTVQWLEELTEGVHTIEVKWKGNLAVEGSDPQQGSRTLIINEL